MAGGRGCVPRCGHRGMAWRAPTALLLPGLQMLAPSMKPWFLSGRSRRALQLSASSLAGSSATWKMTGVSLVWSRLDPFSSPSPSSCTCTGAAGHRRGWVLLATAGAGIWGQLCPRTGSPRLCRGVEPLLPAQAPLSRGSEKGGAVREGHSPACSPAHSPLGRGFWWLAEVGDGGTLLSHVPSSLGPP